MSKLSFDWSNLQISQVASASLMGSGAFATWHASRSDGRALAPAKQWHPANRCATGSDMIYEWHLSDHKMISQAREGLRFECGSCSSAPSQLRKPRKPQDASDFNRFNAVKKPRNGNVLPSWSPLLPLVMVPWKKRPNRKGNAKARRLKGFEEHSTCKICKQLKRNIEEISIVCFQRLFLMLRFVLLLFCQLPGFETGLMLRLWRRGDVKVNSNWNP